MQKPRFDEHLLQNGVDGVIPAIIMPKVGGRCCVVKETVREKYDAIARGEQDAGYCMVEETDYEGKPGYQSQADLGLGCGSPIEYADLILGEIVLDLGSGAGLDAMIASPLVGDMGRVLGIDFSSSMITRSKKNAVNAGINNVSFQEGDIEHLPVEDSSIDVVISNCTLNLVPDKVRVYSEIFRVLRPGGRFVIADVVTIGAPDPVLLRQAEEIAGCVAGAAEKGFHLTLIESAGFTEIEIVRSRPLQIIHDQDGLASLTIRAYRPD